MKRHRFLSIPLYDANGKNPLWTDWCAYSEHLMTPNPEVCGEVVESPIHYRVEELGDLELDTWPDGKPVVVDMTLEPKDFL